jgi:2-polyprenyl-3-methyl-5-hydroxy-6-metoxy-1,4-benzoquinol methylase
MSTAIDLCLCCEGALVPLVNFGRMPLVNTYGVTEKFPLAVNRCKVCCHLQLSEAVDPLVLYSDYTYCSGTGKTALGFFTGFARTALTYVPKAKRVLDIASNDGSQLDAFKALGLVTCGIDPAANLAEIAKAKGHAITVGLFEETFIPEGTTFDIITAQNVVAHTHRPVEFLSRCADIMHKESRLFVATSQANMVVLGECDTIYHEHVSYFNAGSMKRLAELAGLRLLDIVMNDIHGTSYVFVLGTEGEPSVRVAQRMQWEKAVGLTRSGIYRWWKAHVAEKIERLGRTIDGFKKEGFFTVGCGAAAKGISMLNMAGVKLDVLADNTPTKQNKVTCGMRIMPFDEIASLKESKVLFVVLAWNVGVEIRRNVEKLRSRAEDVFIETR